MMAFIRSLFCDGPKLRVSAVERLHGEWRATGTLGGEPFDARSRFGIMWHYFPDGRRCPEWVQRVLEKAQGEQKARARWGRP